MSSDDVLRGHLVWDGHNDLPWEARCQVGYDWGRLDISQDTSDFTHTDIPRLRRGGVGAQFWSVFVPAELASESAVTATLEQIDGVHQMIDRYRDDLQLALSADDVEDAWRNGRIASLLGAEGGHSINCSLGTLRCLYALGVRYLTLTHNDNVPWADAATDAEALGVLSEFGVEVVKEMNRLGMLVDLSHVSINTMQAALAVSEAPVVFSHSSARALCDVARNVPDDVLAVLPANGGVCMVTFVPQFVSPPFSEWDKSADEAAAARGVHWSDRLAFATFIADWRVHHPAPVSALADVVAHVEHVRDVAGIDHVGLGGDYDGAKDFAPELADVSGYPRLFAALAERGWSDADLGKLASGNILRVMRDAERVSARLRDERGPSLVRFPGRD